jgi:hypothetical protein
MKQDDKTGKVTATIQEIAYYNMFLTEAMFELLAEKRDSNPVPLASMNKSPTRPQVFLH